VALASAGLIHQADLLRAAVSGPLAISVGGVEFMWAIGAALFAALVLAATQPVRGADRKLVSPSLLPGGRPVALGLLILVLASGAWLGSGWWQGRPPYPVSAVHPTTVVTMTDDAHFNIDAGSLGAFGLVSEPIDGTRQFVGRVDFAVAPGARGAGTYYVVVIDSRMNELASNLSNRDGGGWDGFLSTVPEQYPWLSAMAPTFNSDDSGPHNAWAVWIDPAARTPLYFQGLVDDPRATAADLTVALIFVGPEQQIFWAAPVPHAG
jgi:hypothetical protein